tara:strand:- start:949 stop:1974 length:1026 start_codon:yes stop_codon:yes gene_type:complete
MSKKKIFKYLNSYHVIIITILAISLLFSYLLGICFGSFEISIYDILKSNLNELQKTVLFKIRMPRVLLAAFVGASLSVSGACLQGLFRNPLADPGLIGVSAGAALGAAFSIVVGGAFASSVIFGQYLLPLSAIAGAALVIVILFFITKGFGHSSITYMLLAGIAINSFAGVGIGILTYISDDSELRGLAFWTMGSFGGVKWSLIIPAVIIMFVTIIWTLMFARKLDLIQLGESEAYRLGVNVKKLKFNIIISSAIIVGIGVSLAGMIGFVGLVVPHIIRLLGGVKHTYLIPSSALAGAFLMIIADLISRMIVQPAELPVGLITSAIGSPFFLWLIFNMRKK